MPPEGSDLIFDHRHNADDRTPPEGASVLRRELQLAYVLGRRVFSCTL